MLKFDVTMDCADPTALAPFWADALGYKVMGGAGAYVLLADPDEANPTLILQRVPEPKSAKSRVHLDLKVPDVEAEASRLEALGAKRLSDPIEELGGRWIVMADPQGNEFCICREGSS